MPGYKGHLAGGLVAYGCMLVLLCSYCNSVVTAGVWLLCALAGSLFPDIDIKSKGQKYFYRLLVILFLLLMLDQRFDVVACMSVFAMVPMLVNHRGLFHRVWFIILLPLLCWYAASQCIPHMTRPLLLYILFFIGGALSHLYLDFGFWQMLGIKSNFKSKRWRWKKVKRT